MTNQRQRLQYDHLTHPNPTSSYKLIKTTNNTTRRSHLRAISQKQLTTAINMKNKLLSSNSTTFSMWTIKPNFINDKLYYIIALLVVAMPLGQAIANGVPQVPGAVPASVVSSLVSPPQTSIEQGKCTPVLQSRHPHHPHHSQHQLASLARR